MANPSGTRVLMLISELGYGGAETSFIRLANCLLQHGVEVSLVAFNRHYGSAYQAKDYEQLNCPVITLDDDAPSNAALRWWHRLKRFRALKAQHHVAISFLSGPNMLNAAAGYSHKTVVSLRGSRLYDPVLPVKKRWVFERIIDPFVFARAARIVPVSAGLKHEVRRQAGEAAVAKIRVISPFVFADDFAQKAQQTLPDVLQPFAQLPTICAVGRLSAEKGFQHLLPVFAKLVVRLPEAKLLLVGDGPQSAFLRAQCQRLGLKTATLDDAEAAQAQVVFAGYQKNPMPFMAASKLYAMTSLTEGLPNVVLEALAAGALVVANDAPWGARAILQQTPPDNANPYPQTSALQADYGVLMPPIAQEKYLDEWCNMLQHALHNEALQKQYAQAGKQRLKDFDVQPVGRKWLALINEMAPDAQDLPIVYVLEPATSVTGSLHCAIQQAEALKDTARLVLVLPKGANIADDKLQVFWRVEYVAMGQLRKHVPSLLRYVPMVMTSSWQLRRMMKRDGATRLQLNDFYLPHGAMLRLLGFRGHIAYWVRCNPYNMMSKLAPALLRLAAFAANEVVAVSRYVQSVLPAHMQAKICYDFYEPAPVSQLANKETKHKDFVFVGNYIQGKGQDVAIDAFAQISAQHKSMRLCCYGGDMGLAKNKDYKDQLQQKVQALGLQERVLFAGFQANTAPILQRAYAAVNASISESFSMTVLEASGASLPVVATQCGGPQEIIEHGKTGFLVPVNDATALAKQMLWLANHPQEAAQMGEQGAKLVRERFSREAFTDQAKQLLKL